MNDEKALWACLYRRPSDRLARMALADLCEEQGRDPEAEAQRYLAAWWLRPLVTPSSGAAWFCIDWMIRTGPPLRGIGTDGRIKPCHIVPWWVFTCMREGDPERRASGGKWFASPREAEAAFIDAYAEAKREGWDGWKTKP